MTTFIAGLEPAPAHTPEFLVFESLKSLGAARALPASSTRAARARMHTIAPTSPRASAGLGVTTVLNGVERWTALQFSNPDRWAAIDRAAQLLRQNGGIEAHSYVAPFTVAGIWLPRCADPDRVQRRVAALASDLLQLGQAALPTGCAPAECLPAFDLHRRGDASFEALLHVPGAGAAPSAIVEKFAQAIVAPLARLVEPAFPPVIQLGVLELERVRAHCSVSLRSPRCLPALLPARVRTEAANPVVIDQLLRLCGLEWRRPTVAALHNAHVLAALAAAATAAGVAPVCFAAEARRHAARWGGCEPLVTWRRQAGALLGELELPLALQPIHDGLRPGAPRSTERELYGRAREIALQVAAVGLAASLAHLRVIQLVASARSTGTVHEAALQRRWAPKGYGTDDHAPTEPPEEPKKISDLCRAREH